MWNFSETATTGYIFCAVRHKFVVCGTTGGLHAYRMCGYVCVCVCIGVFQKGYTTAIVAVTLNLSQAVALGGTFVR